MEIRHGSEQPRTVSKNGLARFARRFGFARGGVVPYVFSTKDNRQTSRNQSVVNTENGEKKHLNRKLEP